MIKKLFRFPWRTKRRIADEVDAELRFHIEQRVEVLRSSGLSAESAELRARQEFGDMDDARRYINTVDQEAEVNRRRKDFMGDLVQDLTYALRKLRSAPAFAITVILTLSVGIGATTSVMNLVNATMLRPPAVSNPGELSWVLWQDRNGRFAQWAYPDFVDYRRDSKSWSGVAALGNLDLAVGGDRPYHLSGQAVSANFFDVIGVRIGHGRAFLAYEDSAGTAAMPIVLSHSTWRNRFNGDSAIVGRAVSMNQQQMTIVGVAPESFTGLRLGEEAAFWVPFAALPRLERRFFNVHTHRGSTWLRVIGRISPTSSAVQAQTEASLLGQRLVPADTKPENRRTLTVNQMRGSVDPAARAKMVPIFSLVMIVPLLVLGVACANVANLFVSRSVQRQKELAVRRALGASRGRLVRQLLTECAILGVLAGVAGVGVSYALTGVITSTGQLPDDIARVLVPDFTVLGITLGLALVAGAAFGLLPALAATRNAITPALKNDGISVQVGRGRYRLRNAFVVSQVALSLTLLITAGLFLGSLRKALETDPGFDPSNTVAMGFDLRGFGYDSSRIARFGPEFIERVSAMPGVEGAALSAVLPLSGSSSSTSVRDESQSLESPGVPTYTSQVSPEYFATMRMPVVQGRTFTATDNASSPVVALVNEQLATQLWPGQDPIGKRLRVSENRWLAVVVGVVKNGKYKSLAEQSQPAFFWLPAAQWPVGTMGTIVIRGKTGTSDAMAAARSALTAIDPSLPQFSVNPLEDAINRTVEGQRAGAALLGVFGSIGLALAAFGIFGVIAQGVAARTREIGIRMSLGARAVDVVRDFVREGLGLTIIGAVVGVVLSLALSKVLASLLFGLKATDVLTFAGATVALMGVAALASFVPARRAAKVDPLIALRSD